MDYNAPSFSTDPNADYVGKTAATIGSKVPPKAVMLTQREIVNAEKASGLTPSNDDRTQLAQSIGLGLWIGNLGANANALVGAIGGAANPSAPGILQNLAPWTKLRGVALQTNTAVDVTVTVSGIGAVGGVVTAPLRKRDGVSKPAIGDVPTVRPFELMWDGTNFCFVGSVASDGAASGSTTSPSGRGIRGLLPTAWGATLTIGSGACEDGTGAASKVFAAAQSLNPTLGNVLNGFDGGTAFTASSTIHVFAVWGASTAGCFSSTSLTPALPAGCTYARRIFSFRTDGSGNPKPYTALETEGGGLTCYLTTQVQDIYNFPITTARQLFTLASLPTGLSFEWLGRTVITTLDGSSPPSFQSVSMGSPYEQDVATPASVASAFPCMDVFGGTTGLPGGTEMPANRRITNVSGQLFVRSNLNYGAVFATTLGWVDFRRA